MPPVFAFSNSYFDQPLVPEDFSVAVQVGELVAASHALQAVDLPMFDAVERILAQATAGDNSTDGEAA